MNEVEFGRYRLLSLIGEGGVGKVYKANAERQHAATAAFGASG